MFYIILKHYKIVNYLNYNNIVFQFKKGQMDQISRIDNQKDPKFQMDLKSEQKINMNPCL